MLYISLWVCLSCSVFLGIALPLTLLSSNLVLRTDYSFIFARTDSKEYKSLITLGFFFSNVQCPSKIGSNTKGNIEMKKFWHNIRNLLYIMQLGSNKILLLAKKRKLKLNFLDFVFHWNVFGCTIIFKVKILVLVNIISHIFWCFYLILSFKWSYGTPHKNRTCLQQYSQSRHNPKVWLLTLYNFYVNRSLTYFLKVKNHYH